MANHKMKVAYQGNLRNQATHFSGNTIISDAPIDNHGKGEAFSPTDLLSVSAALCMITIMGIEANKLQIPFEGVTAEVEKIMTIAPRKVGRIVIDIQMPAYLENHEHRATLENAGLNCPVFLSLHPDVKKEVTFHYTA